jgi:hypothetical protein
MWGEDEAFVVPQRFEATSHEIVPHEFIDRKI